MKPLRRFIHILLLASLIATTFMIVQPVEVVHAADFYPTDADELISAINTANTNNVNDVINLTIDITLTNIDNGDNGLPIILSDGGSTLTIEGNGYTISRSSSGGMPQFRIFQVANGATLTLNNLTLENGYAPDGDPVVSDPGESGKNGGAISNYGTVYINNSIFENNKTGNGEVSSNPSGAAGNGGKGGAIYNGGTLIVSTSTFISNQTGLGGDSYSGIDGTRGSGGAIYNTNSLQVSNSTFITNVGGVGGGIENYGGTATVSGSTFEGNTGDIGGGLSNYVAGSLTIINSTIYNNIAGLEGGGLWNDGALLVIHNTIANNTAPVNEGGGIYHESGTSTLRNSIIVNNTGGNCDVAITDDGYNIEDTNTCGFTALSSSVGTDPELDLSGLQDYGGDTKTIALLSTSPAINAIPNSSNGCGTTVNTDQRGVIRPSGTHCDIGAFEKIVSATFADVPTSAFAWAQIETIYLFDITSGCSSLPLNYCPNAPVTRAQIAVFLLRGIHGSNYSPPSATGTVFADVSLGSIAAAFIEAFYNQAYTSGCGNGSYCPNNSITRAQMAVLLLKAKYGSGYTPPATTGTMFNDVPINAFAAAFIEQLATEGITGGCGGGNYCPNSPVTRSQMAIFIQRTFNLPLP